MLQFERRALSGLDRDGLADTECRTVHLTLSNAHKISVKRYTLFRQCRSGFVTAR